MHLSTNACQKKAFKYSDGSSSAKKRNFSIELKLNCIKEGKIRLKMEFQESVFFMGRTNREGALLRLFSQKGAY